MKGPWRSVSFRAMGSPCVLHLYADGAPDVEAAARAAVAEVERLEAKYSRYRDDSLASLVNGSAGDLDGVEVDGETQHLLDYADTSWRESDGLFDITSGILRRAWDFRAGRLPARSEIEALLACVGWHHVDWQPPRIVLPLPGMELDFGGFVKEYAVDRAANVCREHGVRHGLVDLGGDLAVVGPHPDGAPWHVGIRDPRAPERPVATIALREGGLASSGDYERFIVVDGVRYGHILDPRTGWPVRGFAGVSVAAPHCLVAGTASTIAMLKGEIEGPVWLDELGLPNLRVGLDGELAGTLLPADMRAA